MSMLPLATDYINTIISHMISITEPLSQCLHICSQWMPYQKAGSLLQKGFIMPNDGWTENFQVMNHHM